MSRKVVFRSRRAARGLVTVARFILLVAVAIAILAGGVGPAQSAFPGANGEIAYIKNGQLFLLLDRPVAALAGQPVQNPAWSPDGSKIAFGMSGRIFTYDVASEAVQPISDETGYHQPAWSPDGSKIAFARFDQGQLGIWRVNADGTNPMRLTSGPDSDPAWSPDGGTIAFTRAVPLGEWQFALKVYVMNPDGSGQVRVKADGGGDEQDPAWAPHGDEIALVTWTSPLGSISVMDVNNPGFWNELTSSPDWGRSPAWSPNGRSIVYESARPSTGNDRELFTILADGSGSPNQLTNNDDWEETPDWQPLPAPPGTNAACSIGNTRVDEGYVTFTPAAKFEVDCDNPTSDTYSVGYDTSDETALHGNDYITASGSFSVPPGKSHVQITVNVSGDGDPEPHETFTITLTSADVTIDRPTTTATIVDDDGFSVLVESESPVEGNSGSTDVEIEVSLSDTADQPVPVELRFAGSAQFGQDLQQRLPREHLTFLPGETSKVITFQVLGDVVFEGNEELELSPLSRLVRDADLGVGTLTIIDDDNAELFIDDVTVTEGNAGTSTATFTVIRSLVGGPVSFDFATEDGTATASEDYIAAGGSVSFASNSSTETVRIQVKGDTLDEPNESFRVRLSNPSNATIVDGVGLGMIADDDPAALSIDDVTVNNEGDSGTTTAKLTVTRTNTDDPVSVDFATESGTATPGSDYADSSGAVSFAASSPTATIQVPVVGDLLDEPDETFGVKLSNPTNATLADDLATVTIRDDDPEPTLSIDDVSVTEGDTGTATARFTVSLSAPSGKTVKVDYATADGTATAPDDYTASPPTPLTFMPGAPTAQTLDVPVNGDAVPELAETFTVALSGAQNATIADDLGIGTILDNEPLTALSIDDVTVTEGDSGTTKASFTVRRSHVIGAVAVDFATESGSATPGDDYVARQGTVSFDSGSPTAAIEIDVAGDLLDEPHEMFGVRLSNPVSATIADDLAVGTITDDDPEPALSIDDVSMSEGQTATATARFTVTLSAPSGKIVTVNAATADGTAEAPGDYTAVLTTQLTFDPESTTQTFDVTVNGDMDVEGDETFTIGLTSAENAAISDGQGVGTIVADEAPANDDFADAAPLGAQADYDTSFATVEADEPGLAIAPQDYPSVWYRLSPGRGGVELRAESPFPLFEPKQVAVYTGTSLGGLTLRAKAQTPGFPFSSHGALNVEFMAAAGQEYLVQVLSTSAFASGFFGFRPQVGQGTLTMDFRPAPTNDDFADAAPLGAQADYDTSFATVEADEPGLAIAPQDYPSVWYRLSPGRGGVELRAESPFPLFEPKQVAVYTGTSLGGLTLRAKAQTPGFPFSSHGALNVEFMAAAGQEYLVQVLSTSAFASGFFGFRPQVGQGTLTMDFRPAPTNDDFADAAPLGAQADYDTSFATVEADEPGLAIAPQDYPSVWYRLSPGRGGVELRAESPFPLFEPKQVAVYTGTSLGGLTLRAKAQTPGFPFSSHGALNVEFMAAAGQEYLVQVLSTSAFASGFFGFRPQVGQGTLTMDFRPAPTNDDFADAAPLGAQADYDTSFATVEADEPGLAIAPQDYPSVWYQLAPGLGTVELLAESVPAGKPRQLSVYTGTSPSNLTLVARSSTPDPFPGAAGDPIDLAADLEFVTGCGATYYVQVLGPSALPHAGQSTFEPSAGVGALTRQFQPSAPPANDAFADAATIGLGQATLPPNWWTCVSAQAGEPAHGGAPAAHSVWYRTTVASGRVTVDSPGNRVAVYQGTSLTGLTRVADGASGQASFLTRGGTYLIVVDGGTGTTVDVNLTPGELATGTVATVSTDTEVPTDGATPADPIETSIFGPTGPKTILETQGTTATSAWTFLGWKVEITAPALTGSNRYIITFRIDASLVTGMTGQLDVFRDGVAVPNCVPPGFLLPDPCLFSRSSAAGGDRVIVVRSSRASEWALAIPRTTRGTVAGLLQPSSGGNAEFLVSSNGTTVAGAFTYAVAGKRYTATTVNALGIDGTRAWLAGVGTDKRPFLAYVEDNGPGNSDRFRLWIGGVEQTDPAGAVSSGNIVIRL